jgi:RHS repeat-associated protein
VTGDGTYTYTWDREDRLTGISGGGLTVTYKYDYVGRRSSKTVGGQTTTYIYDGQNLIAERGASVAEYLYGPGIDEPLAMYRSSTAYYYNVDGLGSVNLVNDASGTVQDKYLYDGWGITRSSTTPIANPFVYTGRESGEAGLLYYRARFYNYNLGRFISEDPIKLMEMSLYSYVENNPLLFRDPSGLTPEGSGLEKIAIVICKDGDYQCEWLQEKPTCSEVVRCIERHEQNHIEWNRKNLPKDYCKNNNGPVDPGNKKDETECEAYRDSVQCFLMATRTASNSDCKKLSELNYGLSKQFRDDHCGNLRKTKK